MESGSLYGLKRLDGEHRCHGKRVSASECVCRGVRSGVWHDDAILEGLEAGSYLPGAVVLAALLAELFCCCKQFRGQAVTVVGSCCDHDGRSLEGMGGAADIAVSRESLDCLGEETCGLVEFASLERDDAASLNGVGDAHRHTCPPQQPIRLGGHLPGGFEIRTPQRRHEQGPTQSHVVAF